MSYIQSSQPDSTSDGVIRSPAVPHKTYTCLHSYFFCNRSADHYQEVKRTGGQENMPVIECVIGKCFHDGDDYRKVFRPGTCHDCVYGYFFYCGNSEFRTYFTKDFLRRTACP